MKTCPNGRVRSSLGRPGFTIISSSSPEKRFFAIDCPQLSFDSTRGDLIITTDDVKLCTCYIADQAWWFFHEVDVCARLSGLPFVGAIDQACQFTQLYNYGRNQS